MNHYNMLNLGNYFCNIYPHINNHHLNLISHDDKLNIENQQDQNIIYNLDDRNHNVRINLHIYQMDNSKHM